MISIEEFIRHKSIVIRGLERQVDGYLWDVANSHSNCKNVIEYRMLFYTEQAINLLIRSYNCKHELQMGIKNDESRRNS